MNVFITNDCDGRQWSMSLLPSVQSQFNLLSTAINMCWLKWNQIKWVLFFSIAPPCFWCGDNHPLCAEGQTVRFSRDMPLNYYFFVMLAMQVFNPFWIDLRKFRDSSFIAAKQHLKWRRTWTQRSTLLHHKVRACPIAPECFACNLSLDVSLTLHSCLLLLNEQQPSRWRRNR